MSNQSEIGTFINTEMKMSFITAEFSSADVSKLIAIVTSSVPFLKSNFFFEISCCWNFLGVEEHQHIQGFSQDFIALPSSSANTEGGLFTNE